MTFAASKDSFDDLSYSYNLMYQRNNLKIEFANSILSEDYFLYNSCIKNNSNYQYLEILEQTTDFLYQIGSLSSLYLNNPKSILFSFGKDLKINMNYIFDSNNHDSNTKIKNPINFFLNFEKQINEKIKMKLSYLHENNKLFFNLNQKIDINFYNNIFSSLLDFEKFSYFFLIGKGAAFESHSKKIDKKYNNFEAILNFKINSNLNIAIFHSYIKNTKLIKNENEIIKTFGIDSSFSIPNSNATLTWEINHTKHSKDFKFNKINLQKKALTMLINLSLKF